MQISQDEQRAINEVVARGMAHGFGNLIGHLQTAWAMTLVRDYGMSEETAMLAAVGTHAYPFQMHLDLMERGRWDETGKRYRKPS